MVRFVFHAGLILEVLLAVGRDSTHHIDGVRLCRAQDEDVPGLRCDGDLFLVVNRGWHRLSDGECVRLDPLFNQLSLKLQYTLRL